MLLRLAYLGMTNVFAVLRLLPMSCREKDVEILALRHQIAVLERQLGNDKPPQPAALPTTAWINKPPDQTNESQTTQSMNP